MVFFSGILTYQGSPPSLACIWMTLGGTDKNNRKYTKYVKSKTKSKTTVGLLVTKDKKIITDSKETKCKIMHVGRNNPDYEYTMREHCTQQNG
jgi:hypothetical protein